MRILLLMIKLIIPCLQISLISMFDYLRNMWNRKLFC